MAEPFIWINTYAIRPGKAAEFQQLHRELNDLVEAKEPRMIYFGYHVNDDGSQGTTVQVHADAENMIFHMEVAGDHIRQAMAEYLDPSAMEVQIYGTPTEELLDQARQLAGSGVPVTIRPAAHSFHRF
jgi:hypothetical protein